MKNKPAVHIDAGTTYVLRHHHDRRRQEKIPYVFTRLRKRLAVNYAAPIVNNPRFAHTYDSVMIKRVRKRSLMFIGVNLD